MISIITCSNYINFIFIQQSSFKRNLYFHRKTKINQKSDINILSDYNATKSHISENIEHSDESSDCFWYEMQGLSAETADLLSFSTF